MGVTDLDQREASAGKEDGFVELFAFGSVIFG